MAESNHGFNDTAVDSQNVLAAMTATMVVTHCATWLVLQSPMSGRPWSTMRCRLARESERMQSREWQCGQSQKALEQCNRKRKLQKKLNHLDAIRSQSLKKSDMYNVRLNVNSCCFHSNAWQMPISCETGSKSVFNDNNFYNLTVTRLPCRRSQSAAAKPLTNFKGEENSIRRVRQTLRAVHSSNHAKTDTNVVENWLESMENFISQISHSSFSLLSLFFLLGIQATWGAGAIIGSSNETYMQCETIFVWF